MCRPARLGHDGPMAMDTARVTRPRTGFPYLDAGLDQPGAVLAFAHRGGAFHPELEGLENTLTAFRLAMEQGADGVELDVWRCATGEVVVIHDEDTLRVAGEALRIPAAPLAALRALDVGAWKGARFRGERIPLLSEVLEALPGATVNVELKGHARDRRLAPAAAEVIRRAGAEGRVIVSSFQAGLLGAFRDAAPEVARGFLFEGNKMWRLRVALALRRSHPAAVHPAAALVTAARARRWRDMGLKVNAWTVDAAVEVERLAALGASALITNVPGRVVAVLRGLRRAPPSPSPPPSPGP